MNTQRDKTQIIKYPPQTLRAFEVMSYEWIDNLCFTLDPKECVANADEYLQVVTEIFLEEGWEGDGRIELMWVPPFMLNDEMQRKYTEGITVWHVKQLEDGISWVLYPKNTFNWVAITGQNLE